MKHTPRAHERHEADHLIRVTTSLSLLLLLSSRAFTATRSPDAGRPSIRPAACCHARGAGNKFSRYGNLTGIDVHNNGFAFIQFDSVEDAKEACEGETGTMLHNRRVEVRMFDKKSKNAGAGGGGGMGAGAGGGNRGQAFRDRSPLRGGMRGHGINSNHGNSGMHLSSGNSHLNGPEPFISGFHPQQQQQQQLQQQSNFSSVPPPHLAICPPAPVGYPGPGGLHPQQQQQQQLPPQLGNSLAAGGAGVAAGGEEQANEIEIIVINKDQWCYAEMIEQKIRQETGIRLIDILFLHAPQHIAMTLNDLFER